MSAFESADQKSSGKDDWSVHWQAYAKTASENPAPQMRHEIVLKELRALPTPPELLLDIGSGQGDFLCQAVADRAAKKYLGFELSETGVGISRARVPQAEFIQLDLFSPPVEASCFIGQADVAVCCEVIEHVDEPEEFCRLLKRYLKPGAYLFITVPGGPMSDFDRYIGHRTHYDSASISRLLTAAGFNVEKVFLAGFPFFNLYRMMVVLRGKRTISDANSNIVGGFAGLLVKLTMQIFRLLFKFNIKHSRFGWQIVVLARRPISNVTYRSYFN